MNVPTAPPGWYPDPYRVSQQRWWDGAAWGVDDAGRPPPIPGRSQTPAADTNPWGPPTGPAAPGQAASAGGPAAGPAAGPAYSNYAPSLSPIAPSGLRKVPELFKDIGRLLKNAWLQIIGAGLLIWFGWGLVVALLLGLLLDIPSLARALSLSFEAETDYSQSYPPSSERLSAAWEAVPRTTSLGVWVGFGLLVTLLAVAAAAYHAVATMRLGIEGASGNKPRLGSAMSSSTGPAMKLTGYLLALTLGYILIAGALVAAMGLAGSLGSGAGALVGIAAFLGFLALLVALFWLIGRLVLVLPQVLFPGNALRWSWERSRGRFWAIIGRYLLWSITASVAIQVVSSVLTIPFYGLGFVAAYAPDSPWLISAMLGVVLLLWPVTMALSVFGILGVIPVWRDLTDEPAYRAIDENGQPVVIQR